MIIKFDDILTDSVLSFGMRLGMRSQKEACSANINCLVMHLALNGMVRPNAAHAAGTLVTSMDNIMWWVHKYLGKLSGITSIEVKCLGFLGQHRLITLQCFYVCCFSLYVCPDVIRLFGCYCLDLWQQPVTYILIDVYLIWLKDFLIAWLIRHFSLRLKTGYWQGFILHWLVDSLIVFDW